MAQMTWRTDDSTLADVRAEADRRGHSMNEYVTFVLKSAVDPQHGGSEGERIRARLRRAGLLVEIDLARYDAVHLATALVVERSVDDEVEFAVFDEDLRRAAVVEALAVVPE